MAVNAPLPPLRPLRPLRSIIAAGLARAAAALALLLLLGCHDSPSEPRSGDVSFSTVLKTTLVRNGPQLREVVREEARFDAVWRELWGPGAPAKPAVDFQREMVIVATASLICFGDVEIEQIERQRGSVLVRIADSTATLCSCGVPQYRFHVVKASRVDEPANFLVRPIPPTCPS